MEISLSFNMTSHSSEELIVLGTYCKTQKKGKKDETHPLLTGWPKDIKDNFESLNSHKNFSGAKNSSFFFDSGATRVLAFGLGEKKDFSTEDLRRTIANIYKQVSSLSPEIAIDLDSFLIKNNLEQTTEIVAESLNLTAYNFNKYKSDAKDAKLKKVILDTKAKKTSAKKCESALSKALIIAESVNIARSFVNEPPNVLNSETYAKMIEKDAKTIKGVKIKILGKAELKKEKMGMFLSVNAGSAYQPRLVELTYTPPKSTKNTKHIALVGKGLTFDTGGYSLKPSGSMANMKFDMAGSSTVYGAFRAAALTKVPVKVSCFLGLTDNAVDALATMPDAIVTARNGKTVEILNTDAEGRLVLGDVLSYASDQKPDVIIDSATLTGSCLIALGTEVCGVMSNNNKLVDALKKSADQTDEYIWQLPIIPEWREDMKSNIADLKNIGGTRWGGTSKAAAFLENFVSEGIAWAHLDIAGVGDAQSHLPYCPPKGGSGIMVRTLVEYMRTAK
jgi:leucyl aminopeptidase